MTGWVGNVAIGVAGLIAGVLAGRIRPRRGTQPAVTPRTAPPPQADAAAHAEQLRQLRHDLRGALSPALLAADRLLARNDEAVRHSAEIVIRALERATQLIDATRAPLPATPRDAQTDRNGAEDRKPA